MHKWVRTYFTVALLFSVYTRISGASPIHRTGLILAEAPCITGVAAAVNAKPSPPSLEIEFPLRRLLRLTELSERPEIAPDFFQGFHMRNPEISLATATERADRVDIAIPVGADFPLQADIVSAGVAEGYYFYYPFLSASPTLRYENPAFRSVITMDALKKRLLNSDFLRELKRVTHTKGPLGKENTVPKYRITFNSDFSQVLEGIASGMRRARDIRTKEILLGKDGKPFRWDKTWVIPEVMQLYEDLHARNEAFSVEVWRMVPGSDGQMTEVLAGGALGLCMNGFFSGETIFNKLEPMPNEPKEAIGNGAGKLAIFAMFDYLESRGVKWVDAQTVNETSGRLGAEYIPRREYLTLLREAMDTRIPVVFPQGDYQIRFERWRKEQLRAELVP